MSCKLLIFDMDGTILDSIGDLHTSVNHTLRKFGMPERTLQEVTAFVGNGSAKLIAHAVPSDTNTELYEKVLADYSDYYQIHCNDTTKPYDGILDLLKNARDKGLQLAVVSNKPDEAVKKLAEQYFAGFFQEVFGSRDDMEKKPAPDTVNAIMARLGVMPEETLYIGDSEVDVKTAKNANLACLAVLWGFRSKEQLIEAGATTFFETVSALNDYILAK